MRTPPPTKQIHTRLWASARGISNLSPDLYIEIEPICCIRGMALSSLTDMNSATTSSGNLTLLSHLLLAVGANDGAELATAPRVTQTLRAGIGQSLAAYGPQDLQELWNLANSHHVILRAFPGLYRLMLAEGNDSVAWVEQAMEKERQRIDHALSFLAPICEALGEAGDVLVIKSLDHWPDLGNDLDLYSNAAGSDIISIMGNRFGAKLDERSWGDRLANKFNFVVPGLPELVEVHVARLGQTGEQVALTDSLVQWSRTAQFGTHSFRVPAPENRLLISTLQRMYRHFYLRLCDIVDTARLVESNAVDYSRLQSIARTAGLWDGCATYLTLVSGYVKSYRGEGLSLPPLVTDSARFGGHQMQFKKKFLRIPIFPQAAGLYASEWKRLLLNGELENTFRLSLLPGLAAAAALEFKLTGSDKGIW